MSINIDELFEMLSWNSDEGTQKKGMEMAKNVRCLSVFLQPNGPECNKNVWENCAKVLCNYPDEVLKNYLPELLEWIEDINWPGAEIILNRLIDYSDASSLAMSVSTCVKMALVCDLQGWLGNMSALLNNPKLKDAIPKDIYNVLYCRYQN